MHIALAHIFKTEKQASSLLWWYSRLEIIHPFVCIWRIVFTKSSKPSNMVYIELWQQGLNDKISSAESVSLGFNEFDEALVSCFEWFCKVTWRWSASHMTKKGNMQMSSGCENNDEARLECFIFHKYLVWYESFLTSPRYCKALLLPRAQSRRDGVCECRTRGAPCRKL